MYHLFVRRSPFTLPVGFLGLALCGILLVASACSATPKKSTAKIVTTVTPAATATTVSSATALPTIAPIAATYSVYVDPTWNYSFEYPSTWTVYPATGNNESDVVMSAPYQADPIYAMLRLLVRASNDWQHGYVEQYLCGSSTSTTVAGYQAVILNSSGGDPTTGYESPALGRGFFAKGVAFQIMLLDADKSSGQFFSALGDVYNHVLATFKVGNVPAAPLDGC